MMDPCFTGFFDSRYHCFLLFVISLLMTLGSAIFVLKNTMPAKKALEKVWEAYKPWLILAPLCLISVGIGGHFLIGAFFLLSFFSIKEFTRATRLDGDRGFMAVLNLSLLLIYLSVLMNWKPFFTFLPTMLVAAFLILPLSRDEYQNMLKKVGMSLIAIIYLAWFPAHLALLAHQPISYAYFLFLIIGTELNDASAYLCGKVVGKRLLAPRISPNKTIEGSIGAFIAVSLYVWFVHSWVPGFNLYLSLLCILLITIGGTFGDLIMSFFKRDAGIKDMGSLIPGHGGLLDRIDSLLLISPFYFYIVCYFIPLIGAKA